MATKSISTVEKLMSGNILTGLIMQDEAGYFYRPKGVNGLHKPGKDGQHFQTAKEAKASQAPGATSAPGKQAPTKPAPQGLKPQPRATAAQAKTSQEAPQGEKAPKATQSPQVKEPVAPGGLSAAQQEEWFKELGDKTQGKAAKVGTPQAAYHLNAEAADKAADKLLTDSQEVAEAKAPERVAVSQEVDRLTLEVERLKGLLAAPGNAPGNASKVRYKLVEALGETGTQFWLYPGYIRSQGFKWDAFGGSMFLALGAVEVFLFDNGISLTEDMEKVDIRQGHYDPNKGVILHYKSGEQQTLL